MEELEIYQLPDGERVDISSWPEDTKFLWLASNPGAKVTEPSQQELETFKPDKSIFSGIPIIEESVTMGPEQPGLNIPYEDFDLNALTNNLFSQEVQAFDRERGTLDDTELFDITFAREDKLDDETKKTILQAYNINRNKLKPEASNYSFSSLDDETSGFGSDAPFPEDAMYQQQDVKMFLKQPSILKALEEGLITKQDLSQGMYPGFTSWPTRTSGSIEGMSGITTDEGRELSNAEVYELMWQYDMPYNNDVERLKREARKKVDRFVLRSPNQIESIIDLTKLDQPYIFEEFAEEDGFVEELFGVESLKMDPNFNIKDFNGFLVNRQHKKYLQDALQKIEGDTSENAMKARELLKLQGLNLYLNEQITRDLKQQKLMWEMSNPGRDADTEGIEFNISPGNFNPRLDESRNTICL